MTPDAVARLRTTSSIAHIGTPSTSMTRGTRSTYAAGALRVQRSCGSVRCESTSMMRRSLMFICGVGYAAVATLPMGDLLAYHAERDPTRVAVFFQDDSITYGDLDRWANRLARAYADRGVGFGDLVTIALPNGIEFYAAAFAAYKLGAIPQPLPHRLPRPERDGLIDLGEPALVVGVEPEESRGRASGRRGFEPPSDTLDTPVVAPVGPSFKAMAS